MGGFQSRTPNPSGTICCQPLERCFSAICKCPLIWWFIINLDEIGRIRLAGILLSCVATILMTIAISTEFWVKRFVRGIFVFRGLWIDCQMGSCARPEKVHWYVVVSTILMLTSVVTSYGTVISGTLAFIPLSRPKAISWPWLATSLSFVSGITGAMGLFTYMRFASMQSGSYLSWSLAAGWLAVIAIFVAGFCYFWASRKEEELLAIELKRVSSVMALTEERRLTESEASVLKERDKTSVTAL